MKGNRLTMLVSRAFWRNVRPQEAHDPRRPIGFGGPYMYHKEQNAHEFYYRGDLLLGGIKLLLTE